MYRHELKYIVNDASAHVIKTRLNKICKNDRNADANGRYRVSSLYFDDYCDSAVADNLSGQLARKKFRIRIYNGSDSFIRLERKVKHNGGCRKDTARLTKEQYEKILTGDYSFLQGPSDLVLQDFYVTAVTRLLHPKVIVDYIREAFVYGPGNVRITLDRHVKSSVRNVDLFNPHAIYAPAVETRHIILEVKFTGFLPTHIAHMIQHGNSMRQSASKIHHVPNGRSLIYLT